MSPREKKETRLGLLYVLPAILLIILVAFWPIVRTFYLSLFNLNLKFHFATRFVGLKNYIKLLSEDRFWNDTKVTFLFTIVSVSMELFFGLLIALAINKQFKGRGFVRASVLVPWAIPTVASAMMWRIMYSDQFGVVNDILKKLHLIKNYIPFTSASETTAFWAMVVADVWKTTPFMALLLLAGLQVIPRQLYEAASIDGASKWKQFWRITLPLLKPSILVALVFRTLDAFRAFDIAVVLTGGGPGNSTELLTLYNYKLYMEFLNFGKGSALSILIFLFIMGISFFFIKILGANPYSEGK